MENSQNVNTCGNCKHWSGLNAALPHKRGMCFLSNSSRAENALMFSRCGLVTAPQFYCNQHVLKP